MILLPCLNCALPTAGGDLHAIHNGVTVASVCARCLVDVKKPQITFLRKIRSGALVGLRYICEEVFR